MKKMFLTLAVVSLFFALPTSAQTGTWTAVASTGVIDEASLGIFQFGTTNLTYNAGGSLSPIVARYNVTNTWGATDDTPPWTTLEMGYLDTNAGVSVRADLFRVDPCTGNQTLICSVTSADNATATCRSCTFAGAFNFATNLYYVQVTLSRQTSGAAPHLYTLRIR